MFSVRKARNFCTCGIWSFETGIYDDFMSKLTILRADKKRFPLLHLAKKFSPARFSWFLSGKRGTSVLAAFGMPLAMELRNWDIR